MDFSFTPEQETFRQELRTWLKANVPPEAHALRHLQPQASPEDLASLKAWQKKVYEGGWAGVSWPKEYGGRGASLVERMIFDQEMAAHKAPGLMNVLGLEIVGPTLIVHGTEEQKNRICRKFSAATKSGARGTRSRTPGRISALYARGRSIRAITSSSPARKSGPVSRATPTGASYSCAPIPTPLNIKASLVCWLI